MRWQVWALLAVATVGFAAARADTVVYKDGRVREGTVVSDTGDAVHLRMDLDGMIAVISIPKADILRVEKNTHKPAPAPAATNPFGAPSQPATTLPTLTPTTAQTSLGPPSSESTSSASTSSTPAAQPAQVQGAGHFFSEWLSMGHLKSKTLTPLPPDQQALFDQALAAHQKTGAEAEEFSTLQKLIKTPGLNMETLNQDSYDALRMSLGRWLAGVRWVVLQQQRPRVASFNLDDALESEKPWLAQDFKAATPQALVPMATYMPDPTLTPAAQRTALATALATINQQNCLTIKDSAVWAASLLDGQVRLTPNLSPDDLQVLQFQIARLHQVMGECYKYEAKARAALAKQAEDERKAAAQARQHSN